MAEIDILTSLKLTCVRKQQPQRANGGISMQIKFFYIFLYFLQNKLQLASIKYQFPIYTGVFLNL